MGRAPPCRIGLGDRQADTVVGEAVDRALAADRRTGRLRQKPRADARGMVGEAGRVPARVGQAGGLVPGRIIGRADRQRRQARAGLWVAGQLDQVVATVIGELVEVALGIGPASGAMASVIGGRRLARDLVDEADRVAIGVVIDGEETARRVLALASNTLGDKELMRRSSALKRLGVPGLAHAAERVVGVLQRRLRRIDRLIDPIDLCERTRTLGRRARDGRRELESPGGSGAIRELLRNGAPCCCAAAEAA